MANMENESPPFKLFGKVIIADENLPNKKSPPRPTAFPTALSELFCPRCKSQETKFCYFNNYNVNQPRHFCKACHRYWTAGGALRNVRVGSGRRRSRLYDRAGGATAVGEAAELEPWREPISAARRKLSDAAGESY